MRKSSTSPPKPSIAFSIFILFTVNQMDKQFYWGDHYIIFTLQAFSRRSYTERLTLFCISIYYYLLFHPFIQLDVY
uniref:Uncharacterized protein n=1 Tax=Anguilla anguilla TaxID=7936 RepID=A0A0E9TZ61_ANGAN